VGEKFVRVVLGEVPGTASESIEQLATYRGALRIRIIAYVSGIASS
jgi:hypothetical protein